MGDIVCWLLTLYFWILLLRVVSSWFPISPQGTAASIVGFLLLVTDPVLVPLRRILPPVRLGSVGLDLELNETLQGRDTHHASLDDLLQRLDNQEFDLVAVGRALLSDPAWANKIKEGREADIIPFNPQHLTELT